MSRVKELGVWLHGEPVATLTSPRVGRIALAYAPDVVGKHPQNVPLLSCSLPVGSRPLDAWPFVSGLLPEAQHRQAMAAIAGVPAHDLMGMLARFGRDVAGALVVAPEEPSRREPSVAPYTEETLEREVAELPAHPLGLHEDSELSVAGIQDKLLLVRLPGRGWGRPVHGTPSTHILKVDDRRFPGLVEAEHACLQLAAAAGLAAAESELLDVAGGTAIVVRRFDRVLGPDGVTRVHQEDACQALAVDPEDNQRRAKYERHGGPSLRQVAQLLTRWAPDPEQELLALVDHAVFTVVIGNADAHGKNVGLLHRRPGEIRLAPLYDTVPTMLWAQLRQEAAMAVAGITALPVIRAEHVVQEARGWNLSAALVERRIRELRDRLTSALADWTAEKALRALVRERLKQLG